MSDDCGEANGFHIYHRGSQYRQQHAADRTETGSGNPQGRGARGCAAGETAPNRREPCRATDGWGGQDGAAHARGRDCPAAMPSRRDGGNSRAAGQKRPEPRGWDCGGERSAEPEGTVQGRRAVGWAEPEPQYAQGRDGPAAHSSEACRGPGRPGQARTELRGWVQTFDNKLRKWSPATTAAIFYFAKTGEVEQFHQIGNLRIKETQTKERLR